MKRKTFIILDLISQIILAIITIYATIRRGEFLEYDVLVWFILLGFWQLGTSLIKHNYYQISMKPYLVMVRNFGIVLCSIFILGFIFSKTANRLIFNITVILLMLILVWSIILALLYLYLTIRQLLDREGFSL